MGGLDLGVALASSSNANSGAKVTDAITINNQRGPQIPPWFLFGALGATTLVLIAWIFRN